MISKKNLLLTMNISYGQLYRWKRERLIPDEWFKKVSVSTGQETYFDEELIIPRITKILELKDSYSLEELQKMLNPEKENNLYYAKSLFGIIDEELLIILKEDIKKGLDINQLVLISALNKFISKKKIKFNNENINKIKSLIYLEKINIEESILFIKEDIKNLNISLVHKPVYIFGDLEIEEFDLDEIKNEVLLKIKEKK